MNVLRFSKLEIEPGWSFRLGLCFVCHPNSRPRTIVFLLQSSSASQSFDFFFFSSVIVSIRNGSKSDLLNLFRKNRGRMTRFGRRDPDFTRMPQQSRNTYLGSARGQNILYFAKFKCKIQKLFSSNYNSKFEMFLISISF